MMKKTKGSKITDIETGDKPQSTIRDVIILSQGWIKLALFLVSAPLTIIGLLIYAMSFLVPLWLAIPIGISFGLTLTVIFMEKLVRLMK